MVERIAEVLWRLNIIDADDRDAATAVIEEAIDPWLREVKTEVGLVWDRMFDDFAGVEGTAPDTLLFMQAKVEGSKLHDQRVISEVIDRLMGEE